MNKKLAQRNIRLIEITSILFGFRAYEGVMAVYIALLTDSFAIGMAFYALINISSSVFEVPTGLVSDRIGRRLTLVANMGVGATSIYVIYFATEAWHVYVAAVLAGLSMALRSGTKSAFVYESLGVLGQESAFKKRWGRVRALNRYSFATAGLFGSAIIYFYDMHTAIMVSLIPLTLAFVLSFWLTDVQPGRTKKNSIYEDLGVAWKQFVRRPALRDISLGRLLATSLGNSEYRFRSIFFSTIMPLWLVNSVSSINQFVSGVVMHTVHQIVDRFGPRRSLVHLELFDRLSTFVAILSRSMFGAVWMSIVTSVTFGIREIAAEDLLQEQYTKEQRATMGSIVGLGGNIVYGIAAISLGLLADVIGPFYTLLAIQPIMLLSPFFFHRGLRHIEAGKY